MAMDLFEFSPSWFRCYWEPNCKRSQRYWVLSQRPLCSLSLLTVRFLPFRPLLGEGFDPAFAGLAIRTGPEDRFTPVAAIHDVI
jgi:hypothetical protein